jgi:uncharacterized protein (TIGR02147 family)
MSAKVPIAASEARRSSHESKPYYLKTLADEFTRLKKKNIRYSLRGFAKKLEVDAAALSRIMNGKKHPSETLVKKFLANIPMRNYERQKFLQSVVEDKAYKALTDRLNVDSPICDLPDQEFDQIQDLLHFSIVELTFLSDFQPRIPWMAHRLGRSIFEVRVATERLLRMGVLGYKDDQLVKISDKIFVNRGDKRPSTKRIKAHLEQVFRQLQSAVNGVEREHRIMTSFTVPTNPKKLVEARKMIEEFTLQLTAFLADGEKTEVYQLGIGLAPLTKIQASGGHA